jgi:hypothetical protein
MKYNIVVPFSLPEVLTSCKHKLQKNYVLHGVQTSGVQFIKAATAALRIKRMVDCSS